MSKFYKVTDSRGQTYTRSTANRTYAYAVVNRWPSYYDPTKEVSVVNWANRFDLASKLAKPDAEIIQAIEIDGREYRALKA